MQAYWAYKWIHSPSGHCRTTSINIKVYKSVHMYTHIYMVLRYTGILGIQVNSLTLWLSASHCRTTSKNIEVYRILHMDINIYVICIKVKYILYGTRYKHTHGIQMD